MSEKIGKISLSVIFDKAVLHKRFIIETINDVLKNVCKIEYTSITNFMSYFLD